MEASCQAKKVDRSHWKREIRATVLRRSYTGGAEEGKERSFFKGLFFLDSLVMTCRQCNNLCGYFIFIRCVFWERGRRKLKLSFY